MVEPNPAEENREKPSAARVCDYLLGGARNFAADRACGEDLLRVFPRLREVARAHRAFLRRVARWCLAAGIDQFLDLGSGMPAVESLHEIVLAAAPRGRVAYVDVDPVAVASAAELLPTRNDQVTITRADIRLGDMVLRTPGVRGPLDFSRPVAVFALAVLHFVESDPATVLAPYREMLAPNSVIAISHLSDDHGVPRRVDEARHSRDHYARTDTPLFLRDRAGIAAALDGTTIVPPGLVDIVDWPVPQQPAREPALLYAAVGRV